MKNFFKENLVLVVSLTLPVLLIVLFFLATVIPKSMGAPPQYEMLFTAMHYEYQDMPDFKLDFTVKDQHLMVRAKKSDEKDRGRNAKKLMLYDGKTETVREVSLDIAKIGEAAINSETMLEETKSWTIDPSSASPDGYVLEGPNYGGSGLVGGLFGGGSRGSGYRLKKGSIGYKLPNMQQDYYYNQVQFIGWVVKK